MKARRQITFEIQEIKGRVDDNAQRRQRGDALLLKEDDFVGIDKPKQKLIDWVLDDADSRLKVILVVGMGGLEDHLIDWMSSIRLWITKRFVEVTEFGKTLEEVAEAYLYELLNRNLIQVAGRKYERIKSCRIHDLLREIILSKSKDHNFLTIAEVVKSSTLEKCFFGEISRRYGQVVPSKVSKLERNTSESAYKLDWIALEPRDIRS
ncbi:hypothetical protein TEA_026716 [Camellia sinensis var. sinensis]|uniref:Disease resistance protein winged helix domain-containing protein n=1 Tax=Camellia sinensis var. sinensis TaxID=542762 RepID=A0A4S4CVD5_CAMSN|nr:hypothetical protein TEA_026716 [Camellia sinensis var. sinensis]